MSYKYPYPTSNIFDDAAKWFRGLFRKPEPPIKLEVGQRWRQTMRDEPGMPTWEVLITGFAPGQIEPTNTYVLFHCCALSTDGVNWTDNISASISMSEDYFRNSFPILSYEKGDE